MEVAVVREEDLDEGLRRVAEGGHYVQHLLLVLEGAVLALQHAEEHGGDEHLDLGLEVRLDTEREEKRETEKQRNRERERERSNSTFDSVDGYQTSLYLLLYRRQQCESREIIQLFSL